MPHPLTLLGIAISLAMDALAVSISTAVFLGDVSKRQAFRIYFHFGLFQAIYPVIGWLAGHTVSTHLLGWNKKIAFALLLFVGIKMIWDSFIKQKDKENNRKDPSKGILLLALSTSVSIDALAVGISFSLIGMNILLPALVIGIVTGLISFLGIQFGKVLGQHFGEKVSILGGLVLIIIAFKLLLS